MRTREREVEAVAVRAVFAVLLLQIASVSSATDTVREIVYSHYGRTQPYQTLGTLQARRSHPMAKITVILHDNSNEDAWHHVAKRAGLNIWKPANWDIMDKFRAVYRHASINPYMYEMYCIYRHLMVHQYMVESNATSIICLDLDIALFDDVWKYVPPNSAVTGHATFGVHWTQRSLSEFTQYLWHFYQRETIEVARHIVQIGDAGIGRSLAKKQNKLLDWWPAEMRPRHLSDMYLFHDFVKTTKALSILCDTPNSTMQQCPPALQLMSNTGLLKLRRKNPTNPKVLASEQVKQEFDWRVHPLYGYPQPWLESLTVNHQLVRGPVPGIHFQGGSKRLMPHLLCDDLTTHFINQQELQQACRPART